MPLDTDDFTRLLEAESAQVDAFGDGVRRQMQEVMQDIESDFGDFLEKLLRVEVADFEARVAEILGASATLETGSRLAGGIDEAILGVFGQDSDSLIGQSLGAALNTALSGVLRGGRVNPRRVVRAGVNAAGRVVVGQGSSPSPTGQMRLSRSQRSQEALAELHQGQRNG